MPNIAGARKRLRQNLKKRSINRSRKAELKTEIKSVRALAESGKTDEAATEFRTAVAKLDRAAAKRIIHPNHAARL
ncbi:MAG TPA: 30S ribosomal protein S20, partial [Pirellulales bacterium]